MKYTRTGVVLLTRNYRACVEFYTKTLGLPVMFSLDNAHSKLTCCDMGAGVYLMIESSGSRAPVRDGNNPMWLRFNVADIERAAEELNEKGIETHIRREVWGTITDFEDPDGNRCSLRDEGSFY